MEIGLRSAVLGHLVTQSAFPVLGEAHLIGVSEKPLTGLYNLTRLS